MSLDPQKKTGVRLSLKIMGGVNNWLLIAVAGKEIGLGIAQGWDWLVGLRRARGVASAPTAGVSPSATPVTAAKISRRRA